MAGGEKREWWRNAIVALAVRLSMAPFSHFTIEHHTRYLLTALAFDV